MPIFVGAASSLVIKRNSVGVGTTTTAGRDAGIGTANGMLIYNVDTEQLEVFDNGDWTGGLSVPMDATGGSKNTSSRTGFNVHTFTSSGSIVIDQGAGYVEFANCKSTRSCSCSFWTLIVQVTPRAVPARNPITLRFGICIAVFK